MLKRLIATFLLVAYGAFLTNLLVFKINFLKVGPLMIRLAPDAGEPNLVPFRTIWPYLHGEPNWLIATINLGGNIALFAPVGLLVPLILRDMTWQKSLALAIFAGLAIEGMQAMLRVGIFDIDDVILNALGVMAGYWAFALFVRRARPRLKPP